ncbi:Protein sof1 [Dimargaris cristalligena]|nr:Protein sof1 [Dimargaris cristalligena]
MGKVKAISRSLEENTRQRRSDRQIMHRNLDPIVHPFERAKEYTRALNAAKMHRMFAKPFVANLDGHIDGVYCLAKHPWDLRAAISGSGDGEIRVWDLTNHRTIWRVEKAHQSVVRGVCPMPHTRRFLSVGQDRLVKVWGPEVAEDSLADTDDFDNENVNQLSFAQRARLSEMEQVTYTNADERDDSSDEDDTDGFGEAYQPPSAGGDDGSDSEVQKIAEASYGRNRGLVRDSSSSIRGGLQPTKKIISPLATYEGQEAFNAIDHHRTDKKFVTASSTVALWDVNQATPIQTFEWAKETTTSVRFNPVECDVLASCGADRSLTLYDARAQSALKKLTCSFKVNALSWNPMMAYQLAAASEDQNVYLYDIRSFKHPTSVLRGHVSAVLDVDFSPTGAEVVSGSYDCTIRIFDIPTSNCRDIYQTKRMQKVFCTKFTMDSKYLLSGSDDGNVRIWKAKANEKLGPVSTHQQESMQYNDQLKKRFGHMPEVRRILHQGKLTRRIKSATRLKNIMLDARARKEDNRLLFTGAKEDRRTDKDSAVMREHQ